MRCSIASRVLWTSLVALGAAAGCSSSDAPDVAPVRGTVTLDGTPLPEAKVEFQPDDGRPSYGTTNEQGEYELMYSAGQPGARVGTHTVRITTGSVAFEDGEKTEVPEGVPAKYNSETELSEEVTPGGNVIDFELKSAG